MTVGYGKDLTWNDIGMPIAKPRRCLARYEKVHRPLGQCRLTADNAAQARENIRKCNTDFCGCFFGSPVRFMMPEMPCTRKP